MRRIIVHNLLKILLPLLLMFGGKQCCADTVSIPLRYYHSDHLGSASWITNKSGNPVQHLQYMPYGEPFVNERKSSYEERFTFTGKERDSETGFSYFGAGYYDSDLMTGWLSVDPQSDKFPNISPYNYCNWNPVKLKDSDGEAPVKAFVTAAKLVKKAYNIYKKTGKLTANSLKKAGLNELVSIVDDINTIFSEDASFEDRFIACVDLVVGTELNNGKNNIVSTLGKKKGSLSETKSALSKVKKKLNIENTSSLPKGKGKFGSPMRGDAKKGYRLDPAHPNAEPGSGEEYPHINYWDYTEKKRSLGGIKGVEPIKK